jgi:diacylglycerol kinase family enzyme
MNANPANPARLKHVEAPAQGREHAVGFSSSAHYADRVAVVVNGNAKGVTHEIVQILDQLLASGDLFVSRSLQEGQSIAEQIVERGYRTVLTGGGDGTFVQMVTWVVRAADARAAAYPRFGFLTLGTGNALGWVLGVQHANRHELVANLTQLIEQGGSRPLRLLEVEGTLTPFAGAGADAQCLQHYQQLKHWLTKSRVLKPLAAGKWTYVASVVARSAPEFLFRPHPHVRVVNRGAPAFAIDAQGRVRAEPIETGQVLYEGPSRLVGLSTIPYWGFGVRFFPYADDREDRFHVRVADLGSVETLVHARGLWRGSYRAETLHDFLAEAVSIEYAAPMPVQIGGDPAGEHAVLHARLSPRVIHVVDLYSPPPEP